MGPTASGDTDRPVCTARDALVAAASERISREPSLARALAHVAELLSTALPADGCLIFRVDAAGELVLAASFPAAVGEALRLPGFGVTGRVAVDNIPVVLVEDNPRNPRHRELLGLDPGQCVSRLCVPARTAGGGCSAVVAVHSRERREFSGADLDLASRVADLVGLRVQAATAATMVREYRAGWDAIVATTVAAQEAERRRMAGDLHDGVTQAIASLSFHLSAAEVALTTGDLDYVTAQVRAARTLAELAFDETRSAITGLHSPVLDDLGLAAGLVSMARAVPNLRVDVDAQDLVLPDHVATSLFRIAQEAVQNVVKHAGAGTAVIRLARHGRVVVLSITDDGRGFDPPSQPFGLPTIASTYGLRGMAERVHLLGGQLRLRSRPGEGTTIEVTVPGAV